MEPCWHASQSDQGASALAQSGGAWRFCIRTYASLLVFLLSYTYITPSQVPKTTLGFNNCGPEKGGVPCSFQLTRRGFACFEARRFDSSLGG
jgi:hypothetical protein